MARTVTELGYFLCHLPAQFAGDVLECECRMSVSKEWPWQLFLNSRERHLQLFSSISVHSTVLKPISYTKNDVTQALCSPTNSQYQFDLYSVFLWCLYCGGKVSSSSDLYSTVQGLCTVFIKAKCGYTGSTDPNFFFLCECTFKFHIYYCYRFNW